MTAKTICIPDIGGAEDVDVVEICVQVGDEVNEGDSLVVLETDKASMEVPAPEGGVVASITMKEGDVCNEGDAILELTVAGEADADAEPPSQQEQTAAQDDAEPEDAKAEKPAAEKAESESTESDNAKEAASAGAAETVVVPDIGGHDNVDVIEVCVSVGDTVEEGDSLIVLETDKASMEVPAPKGGVVESISVKEGGTVSEGDAVLVLKVAGGETSSAPTQSAAEKTAAEPAAKTEAPVADKPAAGAASRSETIKVPDIGGHDNVDIVEVCVSVGDSVEEGDSLLVLETDKASMEVPAPKGGVIESISVEEGGTVSEGDAILVLKVAGDNAAAEPAPSDEKPAAAEKESAASKPAAAPSEPAKKSKQPEPKAVDLESLESSNKQVHAGPAVRALAREFGVELSRVSGTGPKSRILKEDVQAYVKQALSKPAAAATAAGVSGGRGIPAVPDMDFAKYGEIELEKMSKVKKFTSENMERCWLNVPHVTHYDEADITELEGFRKALKAEAEKEGVRLTPLPFMIKAVALALQKHPEFNVSMHPDREHIVHKKYIHIGIAVDTPVGLMVPVIRDADKKSVYEIAKDATDLAARAIDRKLMPEEMQGASFSISSLAQIGGTGFTPIVPVPVVGILGIARSEMKPKWNGSEFEPRNMLPLCLSYDHRAINGVAAGRFMVTLCSLISDIRRFVL